mmetsp:Transcript_20537/g.61210  ORF Transcript_20537/g.61210 Transcript_20537/m.61210 type:complete len:274 (+) Transcript_20537:983-1804(+)
MEPLPPARQPLPPSPPPPLSPLSPTVRSPARLLSAASHLVSPGQALMPPLRGCTAAQLLQACCAPSVLAEGTPAPPLLGRPSRPPAPSVPSWASASVPPRTVARCQLQLRRPLYCWSVSAGRCTAPVGRSLNRSSVSAEPGARDRPEPCASNASSSRSCAVLATAAAASCSSRPPPPATNAASLLPSARAAADGRCTLPMLAPSSAWRAAGTHAAASRCCRKLTTTSCSIWYWLAGCRAPGTSAVDVSRKLGGVARSAGGVREGDIGEHASIG